MLRLAHSRYACVQPQHMEKPFTEQSRGLSDGRSYVGTAAGFAWAVSGERLIAPSLFMLGFRETTVAAHRVEHEIEASTLDALVCYLYAEYRMLEQFVERIFFRSPKHDAL
jgi:hypothetical protein